MLKNIFFIGVGFKGYISVQQAEIEKLTNDYLGFVHFPPLLKV